MTSCKTPFRRASLRGNFSEGNFGDDALLLACNALLTDHVHRLCVGVPVCYQDERLAALEEKDLKGAVPDLIVYGGGTQFFSFDGPPAQQPTTSRIMRIARKLITPGAYAASLKTRVTTARSQRIPRIAIGIGVGPFSDTASAHATAALLRNMALVWVRDSQSEEFCRSNGVSNLLLSSDLCFTEAFARSTAPALAQIRSDGQPKQIAIILRDWKQLDYGFFRRQIEVAERLRGAGHHVQFVSLSRHDYTFLTEMSALGEDVLVWDPLRSRLEMFWKYLAEKDLIVTSRFHGAIFALLSNTPFIAIEIEPKLRNLRDMVPELGRFAVDPAAGAELVYNSVQEVLKHREQLLPALKHALSVQRDRARTGEMALKRFLET